MRRTITIAITLFAISVPIFAQAQTNERRSLFYGFVGPGFGTSEGENSGILQTGFGGEGLITRSVGIGGEISYLAGLGNLNGGIGVASVTGGYHFKKGGPGRKAIPFVSGGYSLFFRSGSASGINFGGGVNYWIKERVGMRFEVRDYVFPFEGVANVVSFRVGILFR